MRPQHMSAHNMPIPRPPQATTLEALPHIVERVVATVHPCRIILFGSGARGTMTRDSDFDLLVILPDGISRRAKTQSLYRALADMPYATDVVVATVSDIVHEADNPYKVYRDALRDGVEVYRAAS